MLFTDQRCQEWVGQAVLQVDRDVLLCIPDDSIIPFTLESLVSAICVSGSYIGNCTFEITICVTIVLKVLAEVDIICLLYTSRGLVAWQADDAGEGCCAPRAKARG